MLSKFFRKREKRGHRSSSVKGKEGSTAGHVSDLVLC